MKWTKVVKIPFMIISEYYWQKSLIAISNDDSQSAKDCLYKSYKWLNFRSVNDYLLESYIFLSTDNFDQCIITANKALDKIKSSQTLNNCEKGYLSLYATDLINLCLYHSGRKEQMLLPRVKNFDPNNVSKRFFKYFPLIDAEKVNEERKA